MRYKNTICRVSDFKLDDKSGSFSCYGNIKGNIDHAQDRTLDGAYQRSIDAHKAAGTMPKMFWMHKSYELPVGPWEDMKEDTKGLKMNGRLSKTTMGRDMEILAKDNALDTFSIGYNVVREEWNGAKNCNDLIELDIKEVSWVNFGCNEESRLVGIKSKLGNGETLSKEDLRILLKQTGALSKRQMERVTSDYNPADVSNEIKDLLESSIIFK